VASPVIANRPFDGGNLLARLGGRPLPAFAREIGCASWAELALKFVVSHPAVTCAIPATSQVSHLRENVRALRGPLPDEAMRTRIVREAGAVKGGSGRKLRDARIRACAADPTRHVLVEHEAVRDEPLRRRAHLADVALARAVALGDRRTADVPGRLG
jgi:hypothetical protein